MDKQTQIFHYQGLTEPGRANLHQSHTVIDIALNKTAKETICPLQNVGEKLEWKHT